MAFIATAQTKGTDNKNKKLYIDVHHLEPGKVRFADVAAAHAKDLAVQKKYNMEFIKYWVDTAKGDVYCLSSAASAESIEKTHAEAHGLLPNDIYLVTDGPEAKIKNGKNLFLDIHELGAGNVTAAAVADAHQKDLAVQKKYGVNFINYWVNEKEGVVMCLSEAAGSSKVIETHKEAHGLIPAQVLKVQQGQ
jgi:Protein of unknown function (DUF4242)